MTQKKLDKLVQERTEDLEKANRRLRNENEENREIRAALRYQAILLDNISDAIISTNYEFEIKSWNAAAEEMYGFSEDEVTGKRIDKLFFTGMSGDKWDKIILALRDKGEWRGELSHYRKDGAKIDVISTVTHIYDPDDQPIGVMAVNRNITEQRSAELQLRKYARELQENNKSLERFAYVAAHDLKSPMRTIKGFVEALVADAAPRLKDEEREYLGYIRESSIRMSRLINDLMDLSRASHMAFDIQPVDLNQILQNVVQDLSTSIKDKKAKLKIHPLPTVNADGSQIYRVFLNLVNNALKFHKTVPVRIEVGYSTSGDMARIWIKDNGIGMEPGLAKRIFTAFERIHSRSDYHGTGLGLSICKKIIERHHGEIWMETQPGEGSTFYFTLPPSE